MKSSKATGIVGKSIFGDCIPSSTKINDSHVPTAAYIGDGLQESIIDTTLFLTWRS
jgi:hypothetical protein